MVARHDFLPFGEEWNPPANAKEKKLFTGHERDAETGLDYFGARYYRPQVGRFTTIDPVYTWSENLTDPQRWNRYAYAKDNPLRFIDTDGRSSIVFNGKDNRLYFFDKDGNLIGSWDATNRPSPELTIGRLADGVYDFLDTTTTRGFGDESPNSRLGTYGIFAVEPFMGEDGGMHTGVGIHSGRLNRGGYLWWTNGCIRTTDEAMMTIAYTAPSDPLTSLAVIDNRPANMDSFVLTQLAKMKIAF
ncbi:MAG: hypothetical protein NTV05_07030 [Acidobacteria bacterium]|nr:hypothetical protein [Acidobacteriota bacterium]